MLRPSPNQGTQRLPNDDDDDDDDECPHCMICYTIRKKQCSAFFWYKAIYVWFCQFIMTVVQH